MSDLEKALEAYQDTYTFRFDRIPLVLELANAGAANPKFSEKYVSIFYSKCETKKVATAGKSFQDLSSENLDLSLEAQFEAFQETCILSGKYDGKNIGAKDLNKFRKNRGIAHEAYSYVIQKMYPQLGNAQAESGQQ